MSKTCEVKCPECSYKNIHRISSVGSIKKCENCSHKYTVTAPSNGGAIGCLILLILAGMLITGLSSINNTKTVDQVNKFVNFPLTENKIENHPEVKNEVEETENEKIGMPSEVKSEKTEKSSEVKPEKSSESTNNKPSSIPTYVPTPSNGVNVKGYVRKDGTYVQPHHRSSPRGK